MARSAPKKASKPKKAAARRPASKKSAKAAAKKAARPAARKSARKAAKPSKASAHEAKMKDIRQRVARRRPGMAPRVDPAQQDPSIIPPPQPPMAPVDHLHGNYGDAKARSVARNDNPTNWFRQAPKAKSK